MITLQEALTKAHEEFPEYVLAECIDIGESYVFYFSPGGDNEAPGVPYVTVNKKSGSVGYLTIPPLENLKLIQDGKRINVK